MYSHQSNLVFLISLLFSNHVLSWPSSHNQAPCQSCHLKLMQAPTHPFSTLLPSSQRRNPRCMRCHEPLRFKALSSGKVRTPNHLQSESKVDQNCQICHSRARQKDSKKSHIKTKEKQSTPNHLDLNWLTRCQTCHSPPFSKKTPPSLQKALQQLKLTHTIFTSTSNLSKTRLDSSSTFQVHQTPPPSSRP